MSSPKQDFISALMSIDDPSLICVTEIAISILLEKQGSDKAKHPADILSRYTPETIAQASKIAGTLAQYSEFEDLAFQITKYIKHLQAVGT